MDIKWFDGNSAEGKFILEINFIGGGKGYFKHESYDGIMNILNIIKNHPEILGTIKPEYIAEAA
jgi:hypothetical protein